MPDPTLIFVDGENLSIRYQAMVASGRIPKPVNIHVRDQFIWSSSVLDGRICDIKRLSYYTSIKGDASAVTDLRRKISAISYSCVTGHVVGPHGMARTIATSQMIPMVKKRSGHIQKESVCDIAIAVDVMRACYRDHASGVWLFSGDGDFSALIAEAMHSGKQVTLSAFSSGLSEGLCHMVDEFVSLDDYFFEPLHTAGIELGNA